MQLLREEEQDTSTRSDLSEFNCNAKITYNHNYVPKCSYKSHLLFLFSSLTLPISLST